MWADCPRPPPPPGPALLSLCHWKRTQSASNFYFLFKNTSCSLNLGTRRQLLKWVFIRQRLWHLRDFIFPTWTLLECRQEGFPLCGHPGCLRDAYLCLSFWEEFVRLLLVSLLTTPLSPAKDPKLCVKFRRRGFLPVRNASDIGGA